MSELRKILKEHFNAFDELEKMEQKIKQWAKSCVQLTMDVVNKQAEDEGLWFVAETAAEAYLQEALRKLHHDVEYVLKNIKEG